MNLLASDAVAADPRRGAGAPCALGSTGIGKADAASSVVPSSAAPSALMVAQARPHLGLTFDTGALIALERRRDAMRKVFATAVMNRVVITVPVVVVTEWWRAGHREKERLALLGSLRVEPLVEHVARVAGAALGRVRSGGAIDAIVMASAATRGDVVYTSDPDDLTALRDVNAGFAAVRILTCA